MSITDNQTTQSAPVEGGDKEQFLSSFDNQQVEGGSEGGAGENPEATPQREEGETLSEYEARLRKLQSEKDKYYEELKKTTSAYHEALKKAQLVDELMEDDEAFEAFVYTRKPELIEKQFDPMSVAEQIVQKLDEEFHGYRPESRDDASPQALLYFKRYDELYNQMANIKKPKTFEELKKERELKRKEQEEKIKAEVEKAKNALGWSDEKLQSFREWSQKASLVDLMKVYDFAMKIDKTPSVSNASGTPKGRSARDEFLKTFF